MRLVRIENSCSPPEFLDRHLHPSVQTPAEEEAPSINAPMNDLYETDFVLWAERQADALHRRAASEVDWENVRRGD